MRAVFLSGLALLASLASPAAAEDAWSRAALPSGFASVETPCPEGRTQASNSPAGDAVRCVEGSAEVGFALTNAKAFGIEQSDIALLDLYLAGLRKDAGDEQNLALSTFRGRRSLILVGSERAMAAVEISRETMLLFMVRPLPGKTPDEPASALLERMMNSLEIHDEGAKS